MAQRKPSLKKTQTEYMSDNDTSDKEIDPRKKDNTEQFQDQHKQPRQHCLTLEPKPTLLSNVASQNKIEGETLNRIHCQPSNTKTTMIRNPSK